MLWYFSPIRGAATGTRETPGKLSRLGALAGNALEDLENKLHQEIKFEHKNQV